MGFHFFASIESKDLAVNVLPIDAIKAFQRLGWLLFDLTS
jgi:hypothetical protein